jgi:NADPH:quinone reductase-like Zn-dependent oxidoreductase
MLAATISDGSVAVAEHPDPEPGKGEILVRARAAGLNGADILQVAGHYPAPPGVPPDVPGLEVAGAVVAAGVAVVVAGATYALWPLWASGLILLALGIVAYRP